MDIAAGPGRPDRRLVLASASPGRLALLRGAGFDPEVVASGVAEDGVDGLPAAEAARALAVRKAEAVAGRAPGRRGTEAARGWWVVIGCDSVLAIDGHIRGKPASTDEARNWWLSQRSAVGSLVTGHCVIDTATGRQANGVAQTAVRFGDPSDAEIEAYLATGEPLQVAGALTIDGYGAPFVDGIDGDHGTVIGLSLPLLRRLLGQLGIAITDLWAR
jgi:septum formation protein